MDHQYEKTVAGRFRNLFVLILLLGTQWVYAETPGFPILNLPVGAHAQSMGGAYMPIAEDASAIHNNPSALAYLQNNEFFLYHNNISDYRYDVLAYSHPLPSRRSAIGLSLGYLSKGDFSSINEQGEARGEFDASDRIISLVFAQKLGSSFSVGLGTKFLQSQIDIYTANTFALDLSGSYQWNEKTRVAAAVFHFGPSYKYLSEPSSLPTTFSAGIAHRFFNPITVTSQVRYGQKDQKFSLALAGQFEILKIAALRLGYSSYLNKSRSIVHSDGKWNNLVNLTMGAGLKFFSRVGLNYSFVPMGELGDSHSIDLAWTFK